MPVIASRPELFTIVAGRDLLVSMEAEQNAKINRNVVGYNSEQLCELQRSWSRRGILGAEIVVSNYGCSVRYDSGLQNFGLIASSRAKEVDGTLEDAERYAREWVARDPERRYAWRRNPDRTRTVQPVDRVRI